MRLRPRGRSLGTALLLGLFASVATGGTLEVRGPHDMLVAEMPVPSGEEVCLRWAHSVTGGAVADCFEIRTGQLVLTRSYLHDFAAGLGHLPGRGVQRAAAQGGYWIEKIDEPIPGNALPLQVGPRRVGHRLTSGKYYIDLSAHAAGARVTLTAVSE